MKRLVILITLLTSVNTLSAQGSDQAKAWLNLSIKKYFSHDSIFHFEGITTKRYREYKQDALSVGFDTTGTLTLEQFEEKWSKTYDTSYAGIGESFLTGQQDHGSIVIKKCQFISKTKNQYIFDTTLYDSLFRRSHFIEITVVKTKTGFKIDDAKSKKP